ncbi:MAG: PKD-like domain-containing protein, partial [Bacteroidota bacterium]
SGVSDIFGTLNNTTNVLRSITYTVVPTSTNNCQGSAFSVVVNVNPIVSISGITQVVCSGGSISFTPSAIHGIVPAGTTYSLASATPSSFTAVTWTSFSSGSTNIFGTFTNISNSAQTVVFLITPTLNNLCTNSNMFTVVITINPLPSITDITTVSCEGLTFQVSPTVATSGPNGTVPDGTLYKWTLPTYTGSLSGGSAQPTAQTFISGTLQNNSNIIHTATYLVRPQNPASLGSCVGATFTVQVGILPNAAVNNPLTQTVCSGVSFAITPSHPGDGTIPDNTNYTWTQLPTGVAISGGVTATGVNSISGTLFSSSNIPRTATYLVTPTSPGGCAGAVFSVVITVNPFAYVNAMTRIFCDGVPFTITPTHNVDGTIAQNTSFSWTVQDS